MRKWNKVSLHTLSATLLGMSIRWFKGSSWWTLSFGFGKKYQKTESAGSNFVADKRKIIIQFFVGCVTRLVYVLGFSHHSGGCIVEGFLFINYQLIRMENENLMIILKKWHYSWTDIFTLILAEKCRKVNFGTKIQA